MNIENSTKSDIPEIFRLYALATELQKKIFPENTWPKFDRELIEREVQENRQFKLIIGDKIACIWAIAFQDPQIWGDHGDENSIYIHRIATNPAFKGNNFVATLVQWAKTFASVHQKQFIRMDTCGKNDNLIAHYKKNGFAFLGIKKLSNTSGLPAHYQDAEVCFFEIQMAHS